MERRNFLIGMGAASAGGSILLGSGAFSRIESDRYVTIEVAEDPDAYLGLDACDSAHGEEYVDIDDDGHLYVDLSANSAGGEGVNSDSRTWFDDIFQVCNQGTDDAYVWIQRGDDWPTVEEGEYEGEPRVDFYVGEDETSILGEENAAEFAIGECDCVGIKTNTHGVDATDAETLLEELDDVITLVADVDEPAPGMEQAFFEVSDLDPTEISVDQGETFDVSATITNTGDAAGQQDVELVIDGSVVDSQTVSLDTGENETVSFEDVSVDGLNPGEYELLVRTDDDENWVPLTVAGDDQLGEDPAVLVFSVTDAFRHANIEEGNARIEAMSEEFIDVFPGETEADEVRVDVIDDPEGDASEFPSDVEELEQYDVVVWNSTTGSPLDEDQQAAFEQYVENGGGYAGIHAASDTHYDWEWYGDLVGAYFDGHPAVQSAEINVTDRTHPSTEHLPVVWERTDEWYDFDESPRGDVHVLATLDEDTYDGAGMEGGRADHPIAWAHNVGAGRSWYTASGHTHESWEEDDFVEHVMKGIMWAAGWLEGDATGTVWDSYEKDVLEEDLNEPMVMDVTPDNRLFYIQRSGRVGVIDLDTGATATALDLDVYTGEEDGGLGLAFDPDFEDNGWVYLYYSPPDAEIDGDVPYNLLSRFEVDSDEIDPDSETEILRVHTQRETCCHAGGDLEFDTQGNLYLTTGDDTNPFDSSGYAPIDEREGRAPWDAQRSSANTADLRGSVLRITPTDDGDYAIPEGNLKETWEAETGETYSDEEFRPEIYVMGARNPFRASVDPATDVLYYADYGPDAGNWSAERGPIGIVEYNRSPEPSFDGWPYFTGANHPYVDYDFETGESGEPFDPANPINDSPNNDGLTELPPANPATLFTPSNWDSYLNAPDYADVPDEVPFPSLPGGGASMSGVNYRHSADHGGSALPASFDGKWFIMEWGSNWLKYVTMDEDGEVREIDDFLPDESWGSPMDMAVGPDGTLYVMEYDAGGGWDGNGRIARIDHLPAAAGTIGLTFHLEEDSVEQGGSTTATATLTNAMNDDITDVELSVSAEDDGLTVTPVGETSFDALEASASQTVEWDVVADEDAVDAHELTVEVTYVDAEDEERQLSSGASLTVRPSNPLEGPAAYFSLDGDSPTNEVTGNDATVVGEPSAGAEGVVGDAWEFGMAGDINTVEDALVSEPLPLNGQEATVGAWFNYEDLEDFARAPFQIGGSPEDFPGAGWTVEFNSTNPEILMQQGDGGDPGRDSFSENIPIDPGTWYFVVGVVDGDDLRLHVFDEDGELDASPSTGTGTRTQSAEEPLVLMAGDGREAEGRVDEVRAYSRALSEGSVADLYEESMGDDEVPPEAIEPGTAIELRGEVGGWVGLAPDEIEGDTNPTLVLAEGESYELGWTEGDGLGHNIEIRDADENVVDDLETPQVVDPGEDQWLAFEASDDMVRYVCDPHESQMVGDIDIR